MTEEITLIDRGRGLQLSTSRITVTDLVPYFQQGCSHDEIIRWLPTLSSDEIAIIEAYYRENKAVLDEKDRGERQYREEQVRLQRLRFPELGETKAERMSRLKQLLQLHQERNGEGNPGFFRVTCTMLAHPA